jgi:multiple sugar transport system substrate-binding protein
VSTSAFYSRRALLKAVALGGIGITGGALLSACAGNAAPTAAPVATAAPTGAQPATAATPTAAAATAAPASKGPTKLVFLSNTSGNMQKMYGPVIEKFQAANPGITVDAQYNGATAAEAQTKLLLAISGGTPPDVYWIHSYTNAGVSALNIPQDLASYLKADKSVNLDNYYAAAVKDFQFQGKQNAMPRETTSTILVYNKDIFQNAGVSLPTESWKWSDYLSAVEKLTSGSGPNKTWGTAGWIQSGYIYYSLIRVWQEGGDVVDANRTKYTLDQDPGVKAYTWIDDLVQRGFHPSSAQGAANDPATLFSTGKVAMIPSFSVYSFFANAKFTWDIQHLPHDGKQVTRNASAGHAMTAAGTHKDDAWKLLAYYSGKDAMQAFFDFGLPVTFKSVSEEALTKNAGKPPSNIKIGLDALSYARPEPVVGDWIGIHQTISNALEGVYGPEKKPVQATLTGIADKVNQLIAAKPKAG